MHITSGLGDYAAVYSGCSTHVQQKYCFALKTLKNEYRMRKNTVLIKCWRMKETHLLDPLMDTRGVANLFIVTFHMV